MCVFFCPGKSPVWVDPEGFCPKYLRYAAKRSCRLWPGGLLSTSSPEGDPKQCKGAGLPARLVSAWGRDERKQITDSRCPLHYLIQRTTGGWRRTCSDGPAESSAGEQPYWKGQGCGVARPLTTCWVVAANWNPDLLWVTASALTSLQPVRKGGNLVLCHLLEEVTFPLACLSLTVNHRESSIPAQCCSSVFSKEKMQKR